MLVGDDARQTGVVGRPLRLARGASGSEGSAHTPARGVDIMVDGRVAVASCQDPLRIVERLNPMTV